MQQTGTSWISQAIQYADTYRRADGRWLFVQRDHQLFYGVELGRRPLDQPPAHWPRSATGTGTLPAAWPSWARFWSTDTDGADNHTNTNTNTTSISINEGGSRDGSPH
jgi:hypothetical protein